MACDKAERETGSRVYYSSLSNCRESFNTVVPAVRKGLYRIIKLAQQAIADLLAILALIEFIKKYKIKVA
jgi:hypothetical protein